MSKSPNVVPVGDPKKIPTYNRYRFKTNFQPPNPTKCSPYFSDPRIVPRVRQYLEENKDKYFIDFYDMVNQLQRKYKEYGRRKRSDFKTLVERVVLESYEKQRTTRGGDDSSSDISDMEMITESGLEDSNVANQQMVNLYSKDDSRNSTPVVCTEEEKVINLSSDEDEVEISEDPRAKRFKQNNTSPSHIRVIASGSTTSVPVVNDDVTVTVRPTPARKSVSNENSVEVNNSHMVATDSQPATPANRVIWGPAATPISEAKPLTPAPSATPAPKGEVGTTPLTRLNQSSRKRSRNTQDAFDSRRETAKQEKSESGLPVRHPNYTFQDIGGCTKVLQEVCKLLVHIRHPEIYAQVGVSPPRGFLLHGPPGCGKTLLAGAIAGELKIPLLKVSGPELVAGVSGESEERIRSLFEQAASIAPCVLFLDEVDAICPNRSTAQREMERRIVAQLLSCLDDLGEHEDGDRVLVVGATNRPDSLDPALRRAGRFDREVCLGIPDRASRANILKVVCKNLSLDPEVASDEGMDYLASLTPGFVGADLKALTREAAMVAINRIFNTLQKGEPEEVEMVEETAEAQNTVEATNGKVMEVENGEVEIDKPLQNDVSAAVEKECVIQVDEVHNVEVGVAEEEVSNVIIEEADITIEEPVVEEVAVDGEAHYEIVNEEAIVIAESPINVEPANKDEVEVVTTEVVDLDIAEESLPESQVSEDPRMTITIVTPDGESQTIPAHPLPTVVPDEPVVHPEVIPGTPQIPNEDLQDVPREALGPEYVEQIIDLPPQVVLPEVTGEVPPQVVLPEADSCEVPPHVGLPEVVHCEVPPQVAIPEGLAPQVAVSAPLAETVPQVATGGDAEAVMVVEEVEGMGLSQLVTGTNWSAELNELLSWLRDSPPLTADQLNGLNVTLNDFREALHHVQPSAKREGFATVPDVTWDDVGSLSSVRAELQLAILAPVRYPDQFEQLGITTPTGVLLCGPPGCGKTLLAKAIANEAGVNFISVKGPELLNMYVGESERAVRQVFQRAKSSAPCIIFFDELDSLCPRRSDSAEGNVSSRVVNQLLTEMDGVEGRSSVFLMAATNRPDILDPAVLRPGRLDKLLYVGLPKAADRFDILRALTKNGTKPALASDVDLSQIAQHPACEGYSGADLAALVREAGVQALKEFVTSPNEKPGDGAPLTVASRHFGAAVAKIFPSVTEKDQKHYELLRKMYSGAQRGEDTMDTT